MMKPTDYDNFGGNEPVARRVPYAGSRAVSTAKPPVGQKKTVTYFLTEKEAELGRLARAGKRNVNSAGIFLYVGKIGCSSEDKKKCMLTGNAVEVQKILNSYFEINNESNIVFEKYAENDPFFDKYLGLPFTKGMTDIKTGRTMLIIGDYTHHGQAGQGYFLIGEKPYNFNDKIGFNNVILWNNIGDSGAKGFLGIDYMHKSAKRLGGAAGLEEAVEAAKILREQGFSGKRKVYLLTTPHMREASIGSYLREFKEVNTIDDYCKLEGSALESKGLGEYLLEIEAKRNMEERFKMM